MRVPNPALLSQVEPTVPPPDELIDRLGLRTVVAAMIASALGALGLTQVEYLPEITAIEGEEFSLESFVTLDLTDGAILMLVIDGAFQLWRFEAGTDATDWTDEENPVGRVAEYGTGYNYVFRKLKFSNFLA